MTLLDALTDVEIAFLQVEFSIKLLSYCELEHIDPLEFDTDHLVRLKGESLRFPPGHFSGSEDIVKAASVSVASSLGNSALTLDKAWEVAGIAHDPESEDDTVKLRTLVYMVRCAYAHGVADPKWAVQGAFRRVLHVNLPREPITIDLRELHGQSFDFDQLGGHHKWFEVREVTVARLTPIAAAIRD